MRFESVLLAVTDMDRSVSFYKEVLGLEVITDFGVNKTLTGGVSLQTAETWRNFIGRNDISFGADSYELYFEEAEFDRFAKRLETMDVQYVHPVKEHAWGQRVVRIYDPDRHIIEIGEAISAVCQRFLDSGMSVEQTAKRMDVPADYVRNCIRETE